MTIDNQKNKHRIFSVTPTRSFALCFCCPHPTGFPTARAAGGGKGRWGSLRRERQRPGLFEGTPGTRPWRLGPRQAKGVSQEGEGRMSADRSYRHRGRAWVIERMRDCGGGSSVVGGEEQAGATQFQQGKLKLSLS